MRYAILFLASLSLGLGAPLTAQNPYDPAVRVAAQREAMARLAFLDGIWRGPAWSQTPAGRRDLVQTERVGPMLDGAVRVMEGRGYAADGSVVFNAFAVVSYDPDQRAYRLTSWALGFTLSVPLNVTADGFSWEAPAGPGAVIRYTATVRDGVWHEVGERIAGNAPPVRTVELTLRRAGDTDWPAGGAVPMR